MNHLTQEDIVAAYYGEPASEEHLRQNMRAGSGVMPDAGMRKRIVAAVA